MAFSQQFLDEVKARIGLVDVVGRRVRLIRKGREYSGLCPFHNEKSPSFTVNDEKGFYHCFGCGAHGGVIDFVMNIDKLSFPEAVERLAGEAGLEVPKSDPREREREERAKTLYDVVEVACKFFERQLRLPEGRIGLDYFRNRGVSEDSVKKFRLGYAPDGRGALKAHLAKEGVSEEAMIEAGLVIQTDDASRAPYDRFRGRVMFPITDARGRIIAFGGRILDKGEPKYLNSPETPLFHKGFNLYALAQSLPQIRDGGTAIVVEGYTDVIALHQAGIMTAVAPLGTALTEDQMKLLWRHSPNPVLCFDGDSAGARAAYRAAERALPILLPGKGLGFVELTGGDDPDTLVRRQGAAAFREILSTAKPLSDLLWQAETQGKKLDTPEERAALDARLKDLAFKIADETVRRHYLDGFKERIRALYRPNAGQNSRNWIQKGQKPAWNRPNRGNLGYGAYGTGAPKHVERERSPVQSHDKNRTFHENMLVAILVGHPDLFETVGERLGMLDFVSSDAKRIRQILTAMLGGSDDPNINHMDIITQLERENLDYFIRSFMTDDVYKLHAARPECDPEKARENWEASYNAIEKNIIKEEVILQPLDEISKDHGTFAKFHALTTTLTEHTEQAAPTGGRHQGWDDDEREKAAADRLRWQQLKSPGHR